jgi:dipeptidyl aminopeptidase/acylaminoacyl peptidase
MNKLFIFLSATLCIAASSISYAQDAATGDQPAYDKAIEAISPSSEKLGISLAGATTVDISRYILASNNGAQDAQISPNGQQIAFQWSITGRPQLWLIPTHGGQPKQLTFGNGISFFRWTPDGQSFVYGADNDGN